MKITQEQKKGTLTLGIILIIFSLLLYFKKLLPNYPLKFILNKEIQCKLEAQQLAYETQLSNNGYKYHVNLINDYSGYQLGLSAKQIDLLVEYRKNKKIINSMHELKSVIAIDSVQEIYLTSRLLFPQKKKTFKSYKKKISSVKTKSSRRFNINKVTAIELEKELKLPSFIAKRIINYRSYLKGFKNINQIEKVYDILPYQVDRIKKKCYVKRD